MLVGLVFLSGKLSLIFWDLGIEGQMFLCFCFILISLSVSHQSCYSDLNLLASSLPDLFSAAFYNARGE